MKTFLSIFLAAGMAFSMSHVWAENSAPAAKKTAKKAVKKTAKKAAPAEEADEPAPDISASTVTEYNCAQGHQITVYRNPSDKEHAAIRWNKRILGMKRVETESGAERLENQKQGLVFIGIPAKAMLLDSKKGHQLANDCKTAGQ